MKTGCIIQARMTSTRLPGKVLKIIDFKTGRTILEEVIRRVQEAETVDLIIIATTTNSEDDKIVDLVDSMGVNTFRGSENDVLERYYLAAEKYELDNIIRITSDCPFIDPEVMDDLARLFYAQNADYASNTLARTYPHGLDCEIFSMDALKKAYDNAQDKFFREHVTSYMYENTDMFKLACLKQPNGQDNSKMRITVDTMQDYLLTCVIKDLIEPKDTSYENLVKLFKEHPYLSWMNSDIQQKKRYDSVNEELVAAHRLLKLQEMDKAADILKDKIEGMSDES